MKLLVIRHGKARKANPNTDDSVRELTVPGQKDSQRLAELLDELGLRPALMLCSNAVRARQTCERLADAFAYTGSLTYSPELYEATSAGYYRIIAFYGGHADPLAVIGHNPAAEEFVSNLCARHVSLSTASAAVISCECARWDELTQGMGRLDRVIDQV